MLRMNSKAFSFSKLQQAGNSRPNTSRPGGEEDFYQPSEQRGLGNDFPSTENMASPMLGSIKKMLSVGKIQKQNSFK